MSERDHLTVEELLQDHTPDVIATALWLRDVVKSAVPDADEKVWAGWHGIGFRHPDAGYICGIFPHKHIVKLFFEHGSHLPDPAHILTGTGRRGRSVVIGHPDQVPAAQIVELIDAAIDFWRA